jgi:hypothetical protein
VWTLVKELKRIDISDNPEILRIVEEVRASNEPRVLRRNREDVAIVLPAKRARTRRSARGKTTADYDAFRAAAGSWKDVDTDKLITDIYESRRLSSRPPR